jgi:hypothetical protein
MDATPRRSCIAIALGLSLAHAAPAWAQQSKVVPGLMGPNALPALPVEDAEILPDVTGEVAASTHATGGGGADRAFAPQFRLLVPFLGAAALELSGTPLEVWSVTPATRERFGGRSLSGVSKGDVAFGARFALLREAPRRPALTLRLLTKATTGKGLADRRFTDAPAYAIGFLAAKTAFEATGGAVRRVRLLAKLGLLAWSQEQGLQDDALDYGLAADTRFRTATEVRLEWRGYQGYQVNDKPMLVAVRVLQPVAARAGVFAGVNRGVRSDAPAWEVRAGVTFALRSPFQ